MYANLREVNGQLQGRRLKEVKGRCCELGIDPVRAGRNGADEQERDRVPAGIAVFQQGNAEVDAGVAAAAAEYVVRWISFDNFTRATSEISSTTARGTSVAAP
ncbi:MAG: hypothetical protein ACRD3V_18390 [Vicinamibacteria bacterium]